MCTNSSFDVVSLHSSTLSELVFPLVKILLESLLWNALQDGCHIPECWQCLKICCSSRRSSVFGIAKSFTVPNKVDDHILLPIFGQKSWAWTLSWCKIKALCQNSVFSDKQPHVTLPAFPNNNVSSLTLLTRLRVKNILVFKQDRQCTHHVTLRCVHVTTVATAKKWHITCVSVFLT